MMKIQSKKSSRAIKRALAFGMSLALAMSTLAVAPNADAAKKKVPKLGAKSKTLYYNKAGKKTYTLKVRKNGVKKITKTTWKTSKKSVVAISKKKNTSVKLTAKKAGKATITATVKYTVKGSSEAKTKKLTFKVTSKKAATSTKAPTTAPTAAPTAAPTVAPTAAPTATAEPTKEPTAEPTKEPTAEPTKEPTAEPTQEPIVADVAKVEAIITNSIGGFESTVLAGQDATIQVKVTDTNGNPVANDNVVLTFAPDPNATATTQYQVQSLKVSTTNSKGIATFVVGPNAANVKATNADYRGTYDYSVTDASANLSAKGKLKVANLSYNSTKAYTKLNSWTYENGNVVCLNGNADYADLLVGTNSEKAPTRGTPIDGGYTSKTTNTLGNTVQYVGSQQASTKDEDHKVAFKTGVYLSLPVESKEESVATNHVQTINKTSGKYGTYASKKEVITYDIEDLSNVSYATLTFNSLTLSKYTTLTVGTVNQYNNELDVIDTYGSDDATFSQKNFALQISKDALQKNNAKGLYVKLESQGQVDADNNDGFDVKDLTYVYKNQGTVAAKTVALDSASVKWETVAPVYTAETEVAEAVKTAVEDKAGTTYKSVKASIPAYPYVGNAILKCYDANGTVKKYFACNTVNNTRNENVLVTGAGRDLYEISEAEATNRVGTLTEKDGIAEVDSTASGTTFLKGTVTCTDENVKLDADSDTVYTSVMWNPVEAKAAAGGARDVFMALEGQTITLKAQLVDANGNAVATSGKPISWNEEASSGAGDVNEIVKETTTDSKGQATLKLGADKTNVYKVGVTATEDTKAYNVVLKIGDKTVEKADLYWISLALQFTDKVVAPTTVDTKATGTAAIAAKPANVGENWEYASKVIAYAGAALTNVGALKDWNITGAVNGVVPTLSKSDDAVGTVTLGADGIAKVTSNATGAGKIVSVLDANTKYDAGKIVLSNKAQSWVTKEVDIVGEGVPSVDETLTLSYSFSPKGVAMSFIDPMGAKSATDDKDVYLKVTDGMGNALADKKVKVSTTAGDLLVDPTSSPAPATSGVEVETNSDGIAKARITGATMGKNVTVTAELLAADGSVDNSVSAMAKTYTFITDANSFFIADEKGVEFASPNVVTLTLQQNVIATSVIKELFKVKYIEVDKNDNDIDEREYKVKSVAVDGKKITLTLDANFSMDTNDKIEVRIRENVAKDGIDYSITSASGKAFKADTLTLQGDTVTSANVVAEATTTASAFDHAVEAITTYADVKAARRQYTNLSALAKTRVTKLNELEGYEAEIVKIDAAVDAVKAVSIKADGSKNVDALTALVNGAITDASLDSFVTASTAATGSDVLVGGQFVTYKIASQIKDTISADAKIAVTAVVRNPSQYGKLCITEAVNSAATGNLGGYTKIKVTYSANVSVHFAITNGTSEIGLFPKYNNAIGEDKVEYIPIDSSNFNTASWQTEYATFADACNIDANTVRVICSSAEAVTGDATVTIKEVELISE